MKRVLLFWGLLTLTSNLFSTGQELEEVKQTPQAPKLRHAGKN